MIAVHAALLCLSSCLATRMRAQDDVSAAAPMIATIAPQKSDVPLSRSCGQPSSRIRGGRPDPYRPTGLILREWMRLGGPNGPLGCPIAALQRHPDGSTAGGYVPFQNGAISISPDKWPYGVWGFFQDGGQLFIDWTTAVNYENTVNFDKFQIHWDDGHGHSGGVDVLEDMSKLPANLIATLDYRADTHLRKNGTYIGLLSGKSSGDYTITIQGCNLPSQVNPFDSSHCEGWLHPLPVHFLKDASPAIGDFYFVNFSRIKPAITVEDAKSSLDARVSVVVLKFACEPLPWNMYRNEETYTEVLLAKLAYADYFKSDRCPGKDIDNRTEANNSLMLQKPESNTGTTVDTVPYRTGEYDVALNGLMPVIYRYYRALRPEVANHVIDVLLNKRGKLEAADLVIFDVVPESENHINMTETGRYLTNQLLFQRTHDPAYDNARNGLTDWWLRRLHTFLVTDFIEYNSRPYTGYTMAAVQNLYSYSYDPRVKTAARMVLDYISAKIAASSKDGRRPVPFRRKKSYYSDNFVEHADPNMMRMMMLAGNTEILESKENGFDPGFCQSYDWPGCDSRHDRQAPPSFAWEMLMAGISDYRIPDSLLDVIVNRNHQIFYQSFHHYSDELYADSPSYLIAAGGHYAPYAYTVSGYAGHEDDIGLAVATSFLPAGAYLSQQNVIRFLGNSDEIKRWNMCAAPDFACGTAPSIPPDYAPIQCKSMSSDGHWTFFNRSGPICGHLPETLRLCADPIVETKSEPAIKARLRQFGPVLGKAPPTRGCNLPGYYLAVYQDRNAGLLEAYDTYLHPGLAFQDFVAAVLRNNPRIFQASAPDTYVTLSGRRIQFVISPQSRILGINDIPAFPSQPTTAFGSILNSDAMSGRLTIKNPFERGDIVLDDVNPLSPTRKEEGASLGTVLNDPGKRMGKVRPLINTESPGHAPAHTGPH